jgi:Cation/multidrug efflux pump
MGFTINIVVLFALILSVGLLVDGAIVVVEYADRKMKEGLSVKDAFANASKKMSLPIISSTATTLAAFIPLIFWPGLAGEFMKYLPITLICVLISSLFMALLFVPVLGSILNTVSRILLQFIIPLLALLIFFNILTFGIGKLDFEKFGLFITIGKYLLSFALFIFVFIKIIPRVYKISENVNSTDKLVSGNAKILSSESNEPVLNVTGFVGIYAKALNFLLNHPLKVIISAISILIAVNFTYTKVGEGVEFFS